MTDIKYDIIENIGVLSESDKGWKKELNLISWNDKEAKYDIRDWDENHEKMGKGNTFTKDELMELKDILNYDESFKAKIQNVDDNSKILKCNYEIVDDKDIIITLNYIKIYTDSTYELNFTCVNAANQYISFEVNSLTIDKKIYESEMLGAINKGSFNTSLRLLLDEAIESIVFCIRAVDGNEERLFTNFIRINLSFDFEEDELTYKIDRLTVQEYYAFIETNV